jgi:periplasmic protein CpxP/Spy
MLKKCFLALLAASVISIAVPLASAQDGQSAPPPQSDQQAPPSGPGGGMRHGPMDPAQHTQMLTKKLNLTADQQSKVQSIFETEHSQMESLHQDTSLSQQDRHSKMMDIHKSTDAQVRTILNPTQQKKWDEMQAKREQWGQGHRHGAPDSGDQQAPPPQQ